MRVISEQIVGKYHVKLLSGVDRRGNPEFRAVTTYDNLVALGRPGRTFHAAAIAFGEA